MGENGGSFGVLAAAGRVRLLDSAPRARRNCNLDLNNVASKRPDLLCEPQAGRAVSRHLQLERTPGVSVLLVTPLRWVEGRSGVCAGDRGQWGGASVVGRRPGWR